MPLTYPPDSKLGPDDPFPVEGRALAVRLVNDIDNDIISGEVSSISDLTWRAKGDSTNTAAILGPSSWGGDATRVQVAEALECVSTSAQDAVGGTGCSRVVLQFVDETGNLTAVPVTLTGTTVTAPTTQTCWRMLRAGAANGLTYGGIVSSPAGNITVQGATTGIVYAFIQADDGESENGLFPIPSTLGSATSDSGLSIEVQSAVMRDIRVSVQDAAKTVTLRLMRHRLATDVASPYGEVRLVEEWDGIVGTVSLNARIGQFFPGDDLFWVVQTDGGGGAVKVAVSAVLDIREMVME